MKTSELTGALLDYWVARAEVDAGHFTFDSKEHDKPLIRLYGKECGTVFGAAKPHHYGPFRGSGCGDFAPSTDWNWGGPIIERERIQLEFHQWHKAAPWCALKHSHAPTYDERGPTPLVAAMRVYVASKFGDEVEDTTKGQA